MSKRSRKVAFKDEVDFHEKRRREREEEEEDEDEAHSEERREYCALIGMQPSRQSGHTHMPQQQLGAGRLSVPDRALGSHQCE